MAYTNPQSMAPAYIGAAGGAISTAIGAAANYFSQKRAFEQNKELARIANQFNIDQWNRENAYNDPSAQIARLRASGLNPNLLYGNGPTSTGVSGQLSGSLTSGEPMQPLDYSQLSNNVVANALALAQVRNINADTAQKESQTAGQNIQNENLQKVIDANLQQIAMDIAQGASTIRLNGFRCDLLDAQTASEISNNQFLQHRIAETDANIQALNQLTENHKVQRKLLEKQIDWYDRSIQAQIAKDYASANASNSQAHLNEREFTELVRTFGDRYRLMLLNKQHQAQEILNLRQIGVNLGLDSQHKQIEVGLDSKFGEKERRTELWSQRIGMGTSVVNSACNVFSTAYGFNLGLGNLEVKKQSNLNYSERTALLNSKLSDDN